MRRRISTTKRGPSYTLEAIDRTNTGVFPRSVMNFPTAYVGRESIIEDISEPGFIDKIKSYTPCMHPMSLTRCERQAEERPSVICGPFGLYDSSREFRGDFAGYFAYGLPNTLTGDLEPIKARALITAYADMNRSAVCGGEVLGTIGLTVSMLRRPFGSAQKLLKKIVKTISRRKAMHRAWYNDRKKKLIRQKTWRKSRAMLDAELAEKLAKVAPDTWLEMRYGMLPLMYDTNSIAKIVHDTIANVTSPLKVARSGGSKIIKSDSWSGSVGCWLEGVYEPTATALWTYTGRVSAGVLYRVDPVSRAEYVWNSLGLDTSGLTHAAYELVPGSFVLDWFINVGDWLKAITPRPGIHALANWVTTIEERSTVITDVRFRTVFGWGESRWFDVSMPSGHELVTQITRSVNEPLPGSPVVLGGKLSRLHQVDGMSMILNKVVKSLRSVMSA